MNRRALLRRLGAIALLPLLPATWVRSARAAAPKAGGSFHRVRPSDAAWPSPAAWDELRSLVGDQLIQIDSPLVRCRASPRSSACEQLFVSLENPYFIGDDPGLTQSCGWVDAWTSAPSVYAVAARTAEDVAAAVNFARKNTLRLVIKGGGHSYQGTSNAADSLLVWTRRMDSITLHDAFVGAGCSGAVPPQPAVSVGAGCMWMHVYQAVTARGGRYVQGGGCATVGVAGLVQSGGFGSFSKNYGTAAASLLEAEVVTADGTVRVANACTNPDLLWGLKGGGGGSLGVVTRLTLRTHSLPEFFGALFATVKAASDAAFRRLIARFLAFYAEQLFNAHWGETVRFRPDNTLGISMLFQGLTEQQATAVWKPFFDWIAAAPGDFSLTSAPQTLGIPARSLWDTGYLRKNLFNAVSSDDRFGASEHNVFWTTNRGEAGQFLYGYQSAWLPASLLAPSRRAELSDALFGASRHWTFAFHFNNGLAGAPPEALAAARDTATNPAVLDSFALVICAAEGPPAYPGISGHEPDLTAGRRAAAAIDRAMNVLRKLVPAPGAYVSESNFFERDWQHSFWGANYARLLAVKKKYDPDALFFVHHGVGSEDWSADGFSRRA
jgi:FAD/FMN-containing dehydrogenase